MSCPVKHETQDALDPNPETCTPTAILPKTGTSFPAYLLELPLDWLPSHSVNLSLLGNSIAAIICVRGRLLCRGRGRGPPVCVAPTGPETVTRMYVCRQRAVSRAVPRPAMHCNCITLMSVQMYWMLQPRCQAECRHVNMPEVLIASGADSGKVVCDHAPTNIRCGECACCVWDAPRVTSELRREGVRHWDAAGRRQRGCRHRCRLSAL